MFLNGMFEAGIFCWLAPCLCAGRLHDTCGLACGGASVTNKHSTCYGTSKPMKIVYMHWLETQARIASKELSTGECSVKWHSVAVLKCGRIGRLRAITQQCGRHAAVAQHQRCGLALPHQAARIRVITTNSNMHASHRMMAIALAPVASG